MSFNAIDSMIKIIFDPYHFSVSFFGVILGQDVVVFNCENGTSCFDSWIANIATRVFHLGSTIPI